MNLVACQSKPDHFGVFLRDEDRLEELHLFQGMPSSPTEQGIPSSTSDTPSLVVWQPELSFNYFVLQEFGLLGRQVEYQASLKNDQRVEIRVASLESGTYCFVEGDPLASPALLRTWCFSVGTSSDGAEIENEAQSATEALTVEITPESAPTLPATATPETRTVQICPNSESDRIYVIGLRVSPGVDSPYVIESGVPCGEIVEVFNESHEADGVVWWRIAWSGYTGWMAEKTRGGAVILPLE